MIENSSLGSIMGAPAFGPDDEKIGTVGQVFIDPHTGAPNWATVHTGLFGRHENFVPLDEAVWDREVLRLPYDKGMVKDAPRIDVDEALSSESEAELYRYYGITPDTDGQPVMTAPLDEPVDDAVDDTDRHHDAEAEAAGAEYSRRSRMQRYEASGPAAAMAGVPPVGADADADTHDSVRDDTTDSGTSHTSQPAHTDAATPTPDDGKPKHRA